MFRPLPDIVARLLPSDGTGGGGEFLGRLRTACETVTEKHAPPLWRDAYRDEWVWMLAAVALEERLSGLPKSSRQPFEDASRRLRPALLPGEAARRLDVNPTRADSGYAAVRAAADEFTHAIAPRNVQVLLKDRASFKARLDVFLERRGQSPREAEEEARAVLKRCLPEHDPSRFDGLFLKTPAERLRTYPEQMLCEVARHYLDWGPLMEFLGDPAKRPEQQEKYLAVVKSLTGSFAKRQRHTLGGRDAEDAVQTAMLRVIETMQDPRRGYVYESNFVAWLTVTITNIMRGDRRAAEREAPFDDFDN